MVIKTTYIKKRMYFHKLCNQVNVFVTDKGSEKLAQDKLDLL